ncbi:sensor domain-containing protein [Amycolatopsis sp. NPDC059657]|uniref:sensor domain-containing protein n=1 Tax=Amycolatopsis sp. NPDC059657 TaxID=3346899 RepID=UPI0036719EFC
MSLVVAVFAIVSGCSATIPGDAKPYAAPGTIEAGLATPAEVSRAVGANLSPQLNQSEPPASLGADPESCKVAIGPDTKSVFAEGWAQYRLTSYQESDEVLDHSVSQIVGVFTSTELASKAYRTLADGISACPSAASTDDDGTRWTYQVTSSTPLAWTAKQEGAGDWQCYRHAEVKQKALFEVAVCQAGDGKPAVADLAGKLRERLQG